MVLTLYVICWFQPRPSALHAAMDTNSPLNGKCGLIAWRRCSRHPNRSATMNNAAGQVGPPWRAVLMHYGALRIEYTMSRLTATCSWR
ncbi:hypothetical protein BDV59DRAFT_30264 [Aspergillus ambiguus]|uniref:uncharacterized protein n=1 Tax=Aspergillus ambiguus TaxID=176160 RepID=UPI003CCD4F0F